MFIFVIQCNWILFYKYSNIFNFIFGSFCRAIKRKFYSINETSFNKKKKMHFCDLMIKWKQNKKTSLLYIFGTEMNGSIVLDDLFCVYKWLIFIKIAFWCKHISQITNPIIITHTVLLLILAFVPFQIMKMQHTTHALQLKV